MAELSRTLLVVITKGSLLLKIVADGDILARSRQGRSEMQHTRAWYGYAISRSPPRNSGSSVKKAVANIAPASDEAAPLLRSRQRESSPRRGLNCTAQLTHSKG